MKPLTWNDLADLYNREHPGSGRPARTLPMETVAEWAESRPDLIAIDEEGRFCRREDTA